LERSRSTVSLRKKKINQEKNLQKFYTDDKFRLLIDPHSMASQAMHGSGTLLVNTTDGIQLEIEWNAKGSGTVN